MSAVKEKPKGVTKRDVEARLRDWERRIEALFKQVEEWGVREWGRESVRRGSIQQSNEYMMREFHVPPRRLPTLEFHVGERHISFLPSCLWIVGANGRIDVSVDKTFYTLVDRGGRDGEPSRWEIRNPDPRVILEPFSREVFLRIAKARA
jgi:hypothetical protein